MKKRDRVAGMSVAEIKAEIARLTPTEKAELALELFAGVDEGRPLSAEIEHAWGEEIARRAEAVRNGTAGGVDADAVFAELDSRFPS
ncbi:putative addiction module component (TIGR02574 family) [Ereboglobus sp. PH5-10]|uniref:addiction module protein n=1 Tax=Ereboglobus sp. PH5-10 TaxID=2940629 RepID=UPI002405BFAD|nr:addiction module protein [Ereboglobus sp. PH5-10]MDF9826804.1 putative addiction module component (TIGR02574 family) [Ereboglobus sp. PH5-10]